MLKSILKIKTLSQILEGFTGKKRISMISNCGISTRKETPELLLGCTSFGVRSLKYNQRLPTREDPIEWLPRMAPDQAFLMSTTRYYR